MSIVVPIGRKPPTPRQIVRAWVMRFNAADADGITALYHEDAVASLVDGAPANGTRRIRCMFEKQFRRGTSPRFAEAIYGLDPTVVLEWRDLRGDCGSEFFTVDDDKIASSGPRFANPRPATWLRRLLSTVA